MHRRLEHGWKAFGSFDEWTHRRQQPDPETIPNTIGDSVTRAQRPPHDVHNREEYVRVPQGSEMRQPQATELRNISENV